jgi:hypothetical protein
MRGWAIPGNFLERRQKFLKIVTVSMPSRIRSTISVGRLFNDVFQLHPMEKDR